ncbi:uncharacterized protein I303_105589 [Kwoniella dejecticola CBS 10117]|uniref:Uncharacterized protein n=1 Tax=Kwoniella dejecticola CBS 10117 TaxID=1296121 RepID=A0A1A6A226_9TREE|nr:uncharacterized protein I303_04968 [Kwoniella dejecticola CBS 10117]OBR84111.1 hypothetical protein I303_04968 [Kwoniella dejecticola CBS 10117]
MVRIPRTATDPAPGVGLGLGLGSVLEDSVKSLSKGLIGWFNEREVPDLMDDSDYRIIVKKRLFGKPTYSLRYGRA